MRVRVRVVIKTHELPDFVDPLTPIERPLLLLQSFLGPIFTTGSSSYSSPKVTDRTKPTVT